MPKSQIETYTISSHPLPSPSPAATATATATSNIPRIEIPNNGNDIKIIITEPTPTDNEKSTRIHLVETNPINSKPSTIEIVQVVPPTDRTNTSSDDWLSTEKTYSLDSDRYTRFRVDFVKIKFR